MWVLMLPCETPAPFGSRVCVSVHATGSVCVYKPQPGQPKKDICPEEIIKEGKHLQNRIFLLNLCLHKGLGREDSWYHLSLNTVLLSNKLVRQSHHPDIPPQAPRCCLGTAVRVRARAHREATDLSPFLHGSRRSWLWSQAPGFPVG